MKSIVPDQFEPDDFWLSVDQASWGNFHMTELMDLESDIHELDSQEDRKSEFERLQALETDLAVRLNRSYELAWGLPLKHKNDPIKPLLEELLEYVELDIQGNESDEGINSLANKIREYLGAQTETLENDSDG